MGSRDPRRSRTSNGQAEQLSPSTPPAGSGATSSGGGAGSRSGDATDTRLTGRLPDDEAFEAEYPGADRLSAQLARSLERLGGAVEARVATVWRRHGLSHAGGNALAVIEGAGRPMTPGEIGAEMHITSGSITSLIDTLERRNLVQRASHSVDRRKILVSVTSGGAELLDAALPEILLVVRRMFDGLTDAERARLLDLARRAYDSVDAADLSDVPTGQRLRPAPPPA